MKNKTIFVLFALLLVGCSTPQPTKEPKPEQPTTYPQEKAYSIRLADKDYTLPITYEKLNQDGWEATTPIDDSIEKGTFVRGFSLRKGPYIIKVAFYNNTDETLSLEECLITEIEAENRLWKEDEPVPLTVFESIDYNSTPEDVEKLLGVKPELEETAVFKSYTFKFTNVSSLILRYNVEDNTMRWIVVSNFQ